MKISWEYEHGRHMTLSCGEPGRWEGMPRVTTYRLQHAPHAVSPDRIAVAATLLFGQYMNGMQRFVQPLNVVTAAAIRRFLSPQELFIADIDEGPKAILSGPGRLNIEVGNLAAMDEPRVSLSDGLFVDLESHRFAGSIASHGRYAVATNSFLFNRPDLPLGSLAGGVLLAQSLDAGMLSLDKKVMPHSVPFLVDLLGSVGLGLEAG